MTYQAPLSQPVFNSLLENRCHEWKKKSLKAIWCFWHFANGIALLYLMCSSDNIPMQLPFFLNYQKNKLFSHSLEMVASDNLIEWRRKCHHTISYYKKEALGCKSTISVSVFPPSPTFTSSPAPSWFLSFIYIFSIISNRSIIHLFKVYREYLILS